MMGHYAKEARRHVERIQYYYRHTGVLGYKQAQYHYFELDTLMRRADGSKKHKTDAIVIRALQESIEGLMEEMRRLAGIES